MKPTSELAQLSRRIEATLYVAPRTAAVLPIGPHDGTLERYAGTNEHRGVDVHSVKEVSKAAYHGEVSRGEVGDERGECSALCLEVGLAESTRTQISSGYARVCMRMDVRAGADAGGVGVGMVWV